MMRRIEVPTEEVEFIWSKKPSILDEFTKDLAENGDATHVSVYLKLDPAHGFGSATKADHVHLFTTLATSLPQLSHLKIETTEEKYGIPVRAIEKVFHERSDTLQSFCASLGFTFLVGTEQDFRGFTDSLARLSKLHTFKLLIDSSLDGVDSAIKVLTADYQVEETLAGIRAEPHQFHAEDGDAYLRTFHRLIKACGSVVSLKNLGLWGEWRPSAACMEELVQSKSHGGTLNLRVQLHSGRDGQSILKKLLAPESCVESLYLCFSFDQATALRSWYLYRLDNELSFRVIAQNISRSRALKHLAIEKSPCDTLTSGLGILEAVSGDNVVSMDTLQLGIEWGRDDVPPDAGERLRNAIATMTGLKSLHLQSVTLYGPAADSTCVPSIFQGLAASGLVEFHLLFSFGHGVEDQEEQKYFVQIKKGVEAMADALKTTNHTLTDWSIKVYFPLDSDNARDEVAFHENTKANLHVQLNKMGLGALMEELGNRDKWCGTVIQFMNHPTKTFPLFLANPAVFFADATQLITTYPNDPSFTLVPPKKQKTS